MSTGLPTLKAQGGGDREGELSVMQSEVGFNLFSRFIKLYFQEPEYVDTSREGRPSCQGEDRSVSSGRDRVTERGGSNQEFKSPGVVGSKQQLVPRDVSL